MTVNSTWGVLDRRPSDLLEELVEKLKRVKLKGVSLDLWGFGTVPFGTDEGGPQQVLEVTSFVFIVKGALNGLSYSHAQESCHCAHSCIGLRSLCVVRAM